MKRFLNQAVSGQTLIEVLVALGTAVIVLSATVSVTISALNNAQFSKNQNIATAYAQEGMEIMRKMRNSDPSIFDSLNGSYCLDKGSRGLDPDSDQKNRSITNGCSKVSSSPNPVNIDNIYVRQVDIEEDLAKCQEIKKITVTVSWSSNKCTSSDNLYCHKVELVSCLGDLNTIPLLTPTPFDDGEDDE